jgi:hypothetical protein
MNGKNTSRKNSENTVLTLNSSRPKSRFCNDGLDYWVHNDEHDCISYGKIAEDEPDVIEIKHKRSKVSRTA